MTFHASSLPRPHTSQISRSFPLHLRESTYRPLPVLRVRISRTRAVLFVHASQVPTPNILRPDAPYIKSPHRFYRHRVHIHRLRSVAPTRSDRQRDINTSFLKFIRTRRRFCCATDRTVREDYFRALSIRIKDIFF